MNCQNEIDREQRLTLWAGPTLKLPDMVRKKAMPCLWFVQAQFSLFLETLCSQYLKIYQSLLKFMDVSNIGQCRQILILL